MTDDEPDDVVAPQEQPEGSERSRAAAAGIVAALEAVGATLREHEHDLGRLDEVAGDGDHGRGTVRGIDFAIGSARESFDRGWGAAGVLGAAGDAWADNAGGTSGVLWGSSLRAMGASHGNDEEVDGAAVGRSVAAFAEAMTGLGKAELGTRPSWMPPSRSATPSQAPPSPQPHWVRRGRRPPLSPPPGRMTPPSCARRRDAPGRWASEASVTPIRGRCRSR